MSNEFKNILKKHAKSFYFAGLLLDRHTLNDAAILYAFCRQLDDAVDKNHTLHAVAWQEKLLRWVKDYAIVSVEDAMSENDVTGWQGLTAAAPRGLQLVGDDAFV